MSDISITRQHSQGRDDIRPMVQTLVDQLVEKYGGSYAWEGDTATYSYSGIDASVSFDDSQVNVDVKLGFMMKAFKSVVEKEIIDYMDKNGMSA